MPLFPFIKWATGQCHVTNWSQEGAVATDDSLHGDPLSPDSWLSIHSMCSRQERNRDALEK